VHARVVPYFESQIKIDLMNGKNVLIVAHGNSLRALIKHLEDIDESKISNVELETGEVHCYHLDNMGKVVNKEIKGKEK